MQSEVLDEIMLIFTNLGSKGFIWILLSILLLAFPRKRRIGVTVAISLIFSLIICNIILKNVICRPRPCWIDQAVRLLVPMPKDYSFPSGHTFASFAAAFGVYLHNRKCGAGLLILASIIGFSRLYLFVHFPSDVAAGAAMGMAAGYFSKKITDKIYTEKN